ncbi:hypothetical protein KP509_30G028600 [Ceratopteris richardii]|uniref:Uncharacterized protein n=1 Tax=Ceratopteris richardii TaxID=49495 RepID=A0A8T2R1V1_CERRI|nr:hypothetical protein KP509_30G028600 [Ceratopteris richardii]
MALSSIISVRWGTESSSSLCLYTSGNSSVASAILCARFSPSICAYLLPTCSSLALYRRQRTASMTPAPILSPASDFRFLYSTSTSLSSTRPFTPHRQLPESPKVSLVI